MTTDNKQEVLYFRVTDLWKRLCEEHTLLFDLTCDEYSLLLSSDLDGLEDKVAEKEVVIERIGKLDRVRQGLIDEVNALNGASVKSVSDLIDYMNSTQIEKEQKHLFRFNALLIDIIEKIQAQNKKNQLFLNKAIHSLRDIRMGAMGKKNYTTYNAKGNSRPSPSV